METQQNHHSLPFKSEARVDTGRKHLDSKYSIELNFISQLRQLEVLGSRADPHPQLLWCLPLSRKRCVPIKLESFPLLKMSSNAIMYTYRICQGSLSNRTQCSANLLFMLTT